MSAIEEACPFDPVTRAQRCVSCCGPNHPVPPCVAAYLGEPSPRGTGNVIPLRIANSRATKKAA